MPTWSGWQAAFLTNAELPNTADNRAVLTAWANAPNSNCGNNPIDVSHKTSTSSDCHGLPGGRTAQKYASHADATGAFTAQINSGNFAALLGAFRTGSPEAVSAAQAVYDDIRKWGSTIYSDVYIQHVTGGTGAGGSGGSSSRAPRAHTGWADLQTSVNKHWPKSLRNAERYRRDALRSLQAAHKVKR